MPSATQPALDLQAAFDALRANRWKVAQSSAADRVAKLRRLRQVLLAEREALRTALQADLRRPPEESEVLEIQPLFGELDHAIHNVKRWMRPKRVSTPLLLAGTRSEVRFEPRGLALILAPWNYPLDLAIAPLIAAVAAGNCVLVKPSEKSAHVAEAVARIIAKAFPPDEVACVLGGPQLGEALVALPFDHIFFTGSTRLGKAVMRAAAENLASVTLELGGKSPALVDESADVLLAAERIAWGKFVNAGQTCIAPDYALVHQGIASAFITALKLQLEGMYGPPSQTRLSPYYCRLIDTAAAERLSAALEATLRSGATLEAGGEFDHASRYIAPTILSGVTQDSPIMREEIFGPILPILTYQSLEEALYLIRSRPKPLSLYVFSRTRDVLERVLAQTSAGATVWNTTLLHFGNHNLPFGGVGESGMGSYHGWFGFRAFSHERAVLYQSRFSMIGRFFPPYGPTTRALLAWVDRLMGLR
ncbi:MAG: aldehyde dehydrogenase family protein [Candidatus Koribacter versatilis]|uniref:Aldehyde dehydrogenase n=1 Tax=Candidatus Korobacter versatilis TaxID=658062 RepID=A0A932EPX2_9BACT|nr:aldehyde dehydrogenase family protein [Candidatus Koribacter versatilis]